MTKTIELERGVEIASARVMTLTMREPTVGDQVAIAEQGGTTAMQEVMLFANLCEITPDDIKRLTLKDYRKVQEAFRDFT